MIWKLQTTFFKSIFNGSVWISITISLKYIPKGPIDYKSALVLVMAWHRTGETPLLEFNADPIHRSIYTALGGNKITKSGRSFTGVWYILFSLLPFLRIHRKYSILYLKRCLSVPSYYQYWLQIIAIHPRAISQNVSKIWWQFFMHLSMVNELISKPCTSWVSVS